MDSLSSGAAGRGESLVEDDGSGHIPVAVALAKEASSLFQSRRYLECLDVLNQLLQKKEDDPKVLHNIAVAEYFCDGCSDPRKLLGVLSKIKKRSDDIARESSEQAVPTSSIGNSFSGGSKGSNATTHQLSTENASITADAKEYDTSIATLNTAVVFFHLHEYANALSVLEPLYQNIEPMDETTALHVCLLLLDVALAAHDAAKAADVILYLEKAFGGVGYMLGQGDNATNSQYQPTNQAARTSSAPSNLPALDASNPDDSTNANFSEYPLVRTLSEEVLDYETLLSSLDVSGPKFLRTSLSSKNVIIEHLRPAFDLKLKLHLCKVQLLLLTRNLKATKREVKLAVNMARGRDSSKALLLKSQLEYARGNHRKATKLLMTSRNRTDAGMRGMFNNNLGCIFHLLRKHHISTVFFSRALKSCSALRSEKPLKLTTLSQDKSLFIMYNCGLEYLSCGKPIVAARCLHKASLVLYNQPILWVRLAECCLLALEKGLLKTGGAVSTEGIALHAVGKGKWRQVVVEDRGLRNRHLVSKQVDGLLCMDLEQQWISLPYARQCLLSALHLLNTIEMKACASASTSQEVESSDEGSGPLQGSNQPVGDSKGTCNNSSSFGYAIANGDLKDTKGAVGPNTTLLNSVSAYKEMCRKENHMIKQACLADLAYVELNLENPLKAVLAARSLLQLPDCSRIYLFLGYVYAAEALCRLNRPEEAAELLSVYISCGRNVELPYSEVDRKKWRIEEDGSIPEGEEVSGIWSPATNPCTKNESFQGIMFLKPEESRGILYVNLAAIYAMQGDTVQAHRLVAEALSIVPNNSIAVLGAVYVDLVLGKTEDALLRLKQCKYVRFCPSVNDTVNRS